MADDLDLSLPLFSRSTPIRARIERMYGFAGLVLRWTSNTAGGSSRQSIAASRFEIGMGSGAVFTV